MNEQQPEKLALQTRVIHKGCKTMPGCHGIGVIVRYNGTPVKANDHLEKGMELIKDVPNPAPLLQGLMAGLYDAERCPYVVTWANGYTDVYELDSVEECNFTPKELEVFEAQWRANMEARKKEDEAILLKRSLNNPGSATCTS